MKKQAFSIIIIFLGIFLFTTIHAQNVEKEIVINLDDNDNNENEEIIIITKKGKPNEKCIVEIMGDKIIINGKEVDKFVSKDDKIIVKRKKITKRGNRHHSPKNKRNFYYKRHGDKGFSSMEDNKKGFLGVFLADNKDIDGAKVSEVMKNSPAEKAEIKEGDIIVKVNTESIKSNSDLVREIKKYKSGTTINLTIMRNKKKIVKNVELSSRKKVGNHKEKRDYKSKKYYKSAPIIDFDEIERDIHGMLRRHKLPKLGMKVKNTIRYQGIEITSIDKETPASKSNLKVGDVITMANNQRIENIHDFKEALYDFVEDKDDTFKIKYERNGKTENTSIPLSPHLEEEEF